MLSSIPKGSEGAEQAQLNVEKYGDK